MTARTPLKPAHDAPSLTREAMDAMVSQSRFAKGEIVQDGIGFELRLAK